MWGALQNVLHFADMLLKCLHLAPMSLMEKDVKKGNAPVRVNL